MFIDWHICNIGQSGWYAGDTKNGKKSGSWRAWIQSCIWRGLQKDFTAQFTCLIAIFSPIFLFANLNNWVKSALKIIENDTDMITALSPKDSRIFRNSWPVASLKSKNHWTIPILAFLQFLTHQWSFDIEWSIQSILLSNNNWIWFWWVDVDLFGIWFLQTIC